MCPGALPDDAPGIPRKSREILSTDRSAPKVAAAVSNQKIKEAGARTPAGVNPKTKEKRLIKSPKQLYHTGTANKEKK